MNMEVTTAYFKILSQHLLQGEVNHKTSVMIASLQNQDLSNTTL
jgi:hypothetical protein